MGGCAVLHHTAFIVEIAHRPKVLISSGIVKTSFGLQRIGI
jgi:hypothetical protein